MSVRTSSDLHDELVIALQAKVALPYRYWLWIDVRESPAKPGLVPAPDIDQIASEADIWARMVEISRTTHKAPVQRWLTEDGFEVSITALGPRPARSMHQPPVANPMPPTTDRAGREA
jgi:hypothetical protein